MKKHGTSFVLAVAVIFLAFLSCVNVSANENTTTDTSITIGENSLFSE